MQITNGNLYWIDKTKIINTYNYLTSNESCDVLIIGGGIAGAITAYFLAKEGFNIIIVEKNILGYGNTSACSALIDYQLDNDLHRLEKNIGKTSGEKLYKLSLDALKKLQRIDSEFESDTGFKMLDTIYFTNKFIHKPLINKEYITRKNAGFDISLLDKHDIVNLSNGIITKRSSAIINPYLFTQELFGYLSNFSNVRIYENTKIEDLEFSQDSVVGITNNGFRILANKVVFTSGIETLKYIKGPPTDIYRKFTIVTNRLNKLDNAYTNFIGKDTAEPYHMMRFDEDRIIFSGENIKVTDKLANNYRILSVANERYKRLYNSMKRTVNDLDDIRVDYAFNGTFVNTKDNLPIIDEIPYMPNCFCNLGFGTNGILHSVIGGNILKDAVKGYYTKDMNLFKINR